MSIRVAIRHCTTYTFDRAVSLSPHIFRLRPAPHCRTAIESYSLRIEPGDHFFNWVQDPFSNYQARVVFPEKTRKLTVDVELIGDMTPINAFDFFVEECATHFPFTYDEQLARELMPYLEIRGHNPRTDQWAEAIRPRAPMVTVDFLVELNRQLYQAVDYTIRMEPGVQAPDETLDKALGSCRDSAWLLVQVARRLGLAARFVSGYLVQLVSDVPSLDGPSGPSEDFTDLHAWAEIYIPGAGWIGLDPTSGLLTAEGHIPLAGTPDPSSAAPVVGTSDICQTEFHFSNTVERIYETPRVTRPYSDHQWQKIEQLGYAVDQQLEEMDVRLSMGGEPTFVSIDDMDSPQWNTASDGKHKRQLSAELVRRLQSTFAPGGLLYYGQGKWYPGEPLPRWQMACFWRKDGQPVWQNTSLLADPSIEGSTTGEDAQRFIYALAEHFNIPDAHIQPAYEDVFYYLWKEGTLPGNVDPLQSNLKDSLERQYLADLLSRDMGEPTGFVLPLRWNHDRQCWESSAWKLRRPHLFLIPGASAMGYRLPLDSLEKIPEEDHYIDHGISALDQLNPLPHAIAPQTCQAKIPRADIVRYALCAEVRNGHLHIFLPPIVRLEASLEFMAVLEKIAAQTGVPIVIEGYELPRDPRLHKLAVTPDPGVIEVNIHPSHSWQELVTNTMDLYEQARLCRLGTEKFMLDGRHTGTGGGNHVTLGGPTPADSPLLRRPDILRSLITYWQNHPALSYLFSGMFIGPTSQAPRIDEGRDDRLYELEIAFNQMPQKGEKGPLWMVDRVLRNLLTDLTGNTHRSEFCIDKLYSPDGPTGRLGILELRAFEMPPHSRMSLVQMLLVRSLVAWFWREPYRRPLIHWGTELHDKFMLPHFLHRDMQEVVEDLRQTGYDFDIAWLEPFFEFRFPFYGAVCLKDIELELRMAIEPWHVLGEELSSAGSARYVDSSVERLQIKLSNLCDTRYLVTCNGYPVPLHPTGTRGEYVAGIRYQAWQPHSSLHPTIGIHSPLTFDIVDTWNQRSIGGCVYHVSHPGGRSYETLPVNEYEAQSRRINRFWDMGHTPGVREDVFQAPATGPVTQRVFTAHTRSEDDKVNVLSLEKNRDFPHTLDLRRVSDNSILRREQKK
ncbi:DUF2126 domain-containing protein [Desulfurispira natronophila]|uniref:Uncharacterized protein (DUF2126 family) n=1 Tax=Desulfurispira natronophila TaxID=682562 RepID=A0A7W8DG53_9BACT|nr:transglutaminase family protein [Desulfurispira natronophila]MBB5021121.1 uncharacterized protein (DUF2126 family) [Desulfurispira natronophila]